MHERGKMGENVDVCRILYTAKEAAIKTEDRIEALLTDCLKDIAFHINNGINDGKYECDCPYPKYDEAVKAIRGLGYSAETVTNRSDEKKLHISWRDCA